MPTIEVAIAAHYSVSRVRHMVEVLEAIGGWQGWDVNVVLDTNDLGLADDVLMAPVVSKLRQQGITVDFALATDMAHPWHLTWQHKARLKAWYERGGGDQDLFLYVEDDIVVTDDNLRYFCRYLPGAKARGVLPGFLRFERGPDGTIMSPDYRGHQLVNNGDLMEIDGQPFVDPDFPYWAGFLLDRELTAEYLASPWIDLDKAAAMPVALKNSCRVHAAWALTYWNVPDGLSSRFVVPVNESLSPKPECRVWHAADNYSVSKTHNFGTVKMDEIFLRPGIAARIRNPVWRAQALARRIGDKIKREISSR